VDAIVEAAHLVVALQTVVSRNTDPLDSAVLTVGQIHGGYNYNIIADKVNIVGTCRTFETKTKEMVEKRIRDCCCGVAQTFGGEIDLKYIQGYPCTDNAYPKCTQLVHQCASEIVGSERASYKQKTMGAEDFSYFLQQREGAFLFVGASLPGKF
jgi:amidohydrolase